MNLHWIYNSGKRPDEKRVIAGACDAVISWGLPWGLETSGSVDRAAMDTVSLGSIEPHSSQFIYEGHANQMSTRRHRLLPSHKLSRSLVEGKYIH